MKKKAAVIRRSQQPASAVQHQAATTTTDQHASEQLSELSSTLITSQPEGSSNPFVQFSQLTTSHLDQQQTTNPFTTTSQISQQSNPFVTNSHLSTSHQSVSAFNPFSNTSQPTHSSNPFAPLNQSTSSPASTTNPFEMTDFPIIQSASSPSVFQQTFNYPEPTTPTCSSPILFDTPERPLHRRPIPDRKIDGIFQRLSTLEKNQTDIKNNQQVIMTMLSTTIQLLQGNSTTSTNQSSIYQCQPVITNSETYPFYDVPEVHRINMNDLNYISKHSNCPGHFATKLVDRLFPELFTTEQLRLQYSYHGGGKCNKSELPHDRKTIMQRYILHFYPSLSDPRVWKDAIVPRVNEYLRRPAKQL
ncbi:uncharacterized protein LOC127725423 [Mytilus californianus]|uniref:uncharacterized protein LOC127725423 n=1 Tax=Mytilus californianus TaxID=6549 RepID=UPI00224641B6|nr:uncharacterized protein LOC127725423 [Mytilus californianus]